MVASPEHQPSNGSIEGEFAAETDKMRLAAVERIMDKGFPKEGDPSSESYPPKLYQQLWEQTDSYIAAAAGDATVNKELHNVLQDPDSAKELHSVIHQLKNGAAPDDLLHKQERDRQQQEDGASNWRSHRAFVAFENAVTRAIRTEGGKRVNKDEQRTEADLVGPLGEAARRFIRVAQIMDAESNGTMVRYEDHSWMKGNEELYAADFEKFSQRKDIPAIYRERARETASNLRIDAMKNEKKPEPVKAKPQEEIGFAEEPKAAESEKPKVEKPTVEKPKREYREAPRGVDVKLDYDPSRKVFGKENPMAAEDMKGIQARLEVLTREGNTKNAQEVVMIVADLKRAGVRLGEGKGELGSYLQRQREKVLTQHGRRKLSQYLALGKYSGLFNELSEQENQLLREKVQELAKGPDHKGLARLSRNARYLGVSGYSPDAVRKGVLAEIRECQKAGDLDGLARKASWARQAGIDTTEIFTTAGNFSSTTDLDRQLKERSAKGDWEGWARLRTNLDASWEHVVPQGNQVDGLVNHFEAVRRQSTENGQWDQFVDYAANVNEIAAREARRRSGERVTPVTAEVREHTARERATLTEEEYEAYLGGPEPVRPAPAEEEIDFVEVPAEEAAPEPVVPGNIFTRIWSRFFGRGERKAETPTDTAA